MLEKVAFMMYPTNKAQRAHQGTLGLTVERHSRDGIETEFDLPAVAVWQIATPRRRQWVARPPTE